MGVYTERLCIANFSYWFGYSLALRGCCVGGAVEWLQGLDLKATYSNFDNTVYQFKPFVSIGFYGLHHVGLA